MAWLCPECQQVCDNGTSCPIDGALSRDRIPPPPRPPAPEAPWLLRLVGRDDAGWPAERPPVRLSRRWPVAMWLVLATVVLGIDMQWSTAMRDGSFTAQFLTVTFVAVLLVLGLAMRLWPRGRRALVWFGREMLGLVLWRAQTYRPQRRRLVGQRVETGNLVGVQIDDPSGWFEQAGLRRPAGGNVPAESPTDDNEEAELRREILVSVEGRWLDDQLAEARQMRARRDRRTIGRVRLGTGTAVALALLGGYLIAAGALGWRY